MARAEQWEERRDELSRTHDRVYPVHAHAVTNCDHLARLKFTRNLSYAFRVPHLLAELPGIVERPPRHCLPETVNRSISRKQCRPDSDNHVLHGKSGTPFWS